MDDYNVKTGSDKTDVVGEFVKACNEEGVKPRRGEKWHPFTISKIMTKHGVVKGERKDG